ncbi:MAG: phosphoenolpyruvate hydrolase family protein [Lachnospiraceae bacterium]|jgi:predicted TIM-barrel enzyme|nr:phosphoenolpyruvate hydrolase family protein [Lachnospiraceae bacterium]
MRRDEILKRLHEKAAMGEPIIGTGAGTGLSAKSEEAGGSDLIIVYNSGWFRMQGLPSVCGNFPLGDANSIMLKLGKVVLPVVKHTPVLAGVFANDPFRDMRTFLKQVKEMGFSGVQNFPTVGTYTHVYRENIESVGISYEKEVEMIHIAHELDLLTTPYAYTAKEAEKMTKAGADIVVAHCRGTVGGMVGVAKEGIMTIEEACKRVQEIHDAVKEVNEETLVICHGGPIAGPKDVEYVLKHTKGVAGFYGASSAERLPVEEAIRTQVEHFRSVRL